MRKEERSEKNSLRRPPVAVLVVQVVKPLDPQTASRLLTERSDPAPPAAGVKPGHSPMGPSEEAEAPLKRV